MVFFSKSLKDLQDQAVADFEEAKREKLTEENIPSRIAGE